MNADALFDDKYFTALVGSGFNVSVEDDGIDMTPSDSQYPFVSEEDEAYEEIIDILDQVSGTTRPRLLKALLQQYSEEYFDGFGMG